MKWNSNAAKLISKDPNYSSFVFDFVNITEIDVCLIIFTDGFIENPKINSTEEYHKRVKIR